jgi:hypothetical protein
VQESELEEGEIGEDGELEESLHRSVITSNSFPSWLRPIIASCRQFFSAADLSSATAHYRHNNFSPGFGGEQDYSYGEDYGGDGDASDDVNESYEEEESYEVDNSQEADDENDQD